MDHFPWDSLPTEIQRSILSLLPVSTLIACTSVSASLRSTIRSQNFTSSYRPPISKQKSSETIFLLSDCYPAVSEAYNPSSDRWTSLPIPSNLVAVQFSHGHSVLARTRLHHQETEALTVFNPLRPNLDPKPVPPTPKGYHLLGFFTLQPPPTPHFKIVAVTDSNHPRSQIYDSALGEWRVAAEIPHRFALLDCGVFMEDDGLFYCVSRCPDHILTLDIAAAASQWTILKLRMPAPSLLCLHLFGFSCRLFLAAAVERYGSIVGVGVWELDRAAVKWSLSCSMPDEQFATFSAGGLNGFETIDCCGLVCFYNSNDSGKTLGDSMMMCDLLEKRWWRPRKCSFPKVKGYYRHAVEPCIDLVWGSN